MYAADLHGTTGIFSRNVNERFSSFAKVLKSFYRLLTYQQHMPAPLMRACIFNVESDVVFGRGPLQ